MHVGFAFPIKEQCLIWEGGWSGETARLGIL